MKTSTTSFICLAPRLVLSILLLCLGYAVQAQSIKASGVVQEADNTPLPGVSVVVKGTTKGVITDAAGAFSIQVDQGATLVFSSIGYGTVEQPASATMQVSMSESAHEIEDVVVVGYGTQRRGDIGGAVSSVKPKEMLTIPTTDVAEMLRGRVAGVQISLGSARPGGTSDILIRGQRSLSGNNAPLFILDGVPVENIDDVNANDIASLEVLKDASAQSIYGARAANGVIIVSTKRAEAGKVQVDFSANVSQQTIKRNFELFSPTEWVELQMAQQGHFGGINSMSPALVEAMISDPMYINNFRKGRTTNWEDVLISPAWQQIYNLSIRGGTEGTRITSSFNYFDQQGMIQGTSFNRITGRFNLDQKITKTIKMGANVAFNSSTQYLEDGAEGGSSSSRSVLREAMRLSPYASPYDDEGNLARLINDNQKYNPLWNLEQHSDKRVINNVLVNVFGEWEMLPGLKYRVNTSANYRDTRRESYESSLHEQGSAKHGWGQLSFRNETDLLIENILSYDKKINEDNRFDVMVMQSANAIRTEDFSISATDFLVDEFGVNGIMNAANLGKPSRGIKPRRLLSYLGRARYTFKERYSLTASLRYDGASVFGTENKWGMFPSVAAAWRVNEEAFLKEIATISSLKLRASYGVVGNQGVSPFGTTAGTEVTDMLFGTSTGRPQDSPTQGLRPSTIMPNPFLKWERSATLNLGLDFGLLKNRLTGSVEWYDTRTTDLLVDRTLPSTSGYVQQKSNMGEVQNTGVEIQLGAVPVQTQEFTWTANLVFARNVNEILRIDGRTDADGKPLDNPGAGGGDGWYIGQPMSVHYYYRPDGIFNSVEEVRNSPQGKNPVDGSPVSEAQLQNTVGRVRVKDLNGDGVITADDREFMRIMPSWTGSISTTLAYKGVELFLDLYTSQGGMMKNNFLYDGEYGGSLANSYNGIKRDYWTPEGLGQEAPKPIANNASPYIQALGYEDASYIRLRTISLAYNLPKVWMQKVKMSNAKVFVQLNNYFTWTDVQSFSPEKSPSSYPEPRIFTMGLNLSF